MPQEDDSTYGFNRSDAHDLIHLIGNGDHEFHELQPHYRRRPGGTQIIEFTINHPYSYGSDGGGEKCEDKEEDAPTTVRAQVSMRPCGVKKVTGEDDNGFVTVVDTTGSFLANRESDEINGKVGFAAYLWDGYECVWAIFWIDWFRDRVNVVDVVDTGSSILVKYERQSVWDHCELDPSEIETVDCETSSGSGPS